MKGNPLIFFKRPLSFLRRFRVIIVLLLFVIWMFFFDKNNFLSQIELYRIYKTYEAEKEYYQNEINECYAKIELLENDQDYIEKVGREKYFLKRDNEVIYYVVSEENLQD